MSLTLQESAVLVGGHCWLERRLFERLGRWVAPSASTTTKLLLDRHSQHAVWRAEQWWDRLPLLAQVDRDQLVAPPGRWRAVLAEAGPAAGAGQPVAGQPLAEVSPAEAALGDGPINDVTRLAVAYRVWLPRLAGRYERHLQATVEVADGPVIRTLGHVAADLRADWAAGEFQLEELLASADDVTAAGVVVAGAERLFV